ncbi:MAG: RimK family alpha-L-glutamate ligase [Planctomycetales bacterium]|nr:RimK family alpha-L-glutamate ligase [Planctomycetales bacterium]MCA9208605.1 RimK family alpha-L-glutamate ligase [Planctomycetales bacterium]
MRLAILGNPDSWYAQDVRRAAADRHEVVALPFSEIQAALGMRPDTSPTAFPNESPRPHSPAGTHSLSNLPTNSLINSSISTSGCGLDHFDAVLVRTMPPGSLEQVVFRMDTLARLEAAGVLVVNSPKSIEVAVDKYLASARLEAAGLPTPPTIVCQTVDDAMRAFEQLGGDVVLKPLFGAEGRGIARLTDENLALRAFKMLEQLGAVLYLQQFIPHPGHDLRLFVLAGRVWGMRRRNETDWRTNVSRGATTEPIEMSERLAELACRAADAVGAIVAGVDVLPALSGGEYVLEVNAVPGWKALARTLKVDIAAELLDTINHRLQSRTN